MYVKEYVSVCIHTLAYNFFGGGVERSFVSKILAWTPVILGKWHIQDVKKRNVYVCVRCMYVCVCTLWISYKGNLSPLPSICLY